MSALADGHESNLQVAVQHLKNEMLIQGARQDRPCLAVLVKRTYTIDSNGQCHLSDKNDQEPISDSYFCYDAVDPPDVSPVRIDNDLLAFRESTDLVIQASAYTYGTSSNEIVASVRHGRFYREIKVYGDRRLEYHSGSLGISAAEPFDRMPIRYDRAFGGVDQRALQSAITPELEQLFAARPNYRKLRSSPFHYPRNPSGVGFLTQPAPDAIAELDIPNLEYPSDPITLQRMIIASTQPWTRAPLPACWDWLSPDWFPRCGHIGFAEIPDGERPAEIALGWASENLCSAPKFPEVLAAPPRPEFAQGASPGMSLRNFELEQPVVLTHLHPEQPLFQLQLPTARPTLELSAQPGSSQSMLPHLNAVVIRPDEEQIVMVWCSSLETNRTYSPDELERMSFTIAWSDAPGD